jgi:hypothetical protein
MSALSVGDALLVLVSDASRKTMFNLQSARHRGGDVLALNKLMLMGRTRTLVSTGALMGAVTPADYAKSVSDW